MKENMNTIDYIPADKELQKIEYELLKEFVRVCDEHGLRYFLIGGTLLGAVRHSGFIPWDDDIDVGMPRKDYDILLMNACTWFEDDCKLSFWKNTEEYVYTFAKFEDVNTELIEFDYSHLKKRNGGVYIDIFPFDGMPSTPLFRIFWYIFLRTLNRINILMFCKTSLKDIKITPKNICKALIGKICQSIFSRHKIHRVYDRLMRCFDFDSSEYVINFEGQWAMKELVPNSFFTQVAEVTFNYSSFKTMGNYKEYLTCIYGDYMKLPPIEKRVTHHDFTWSIKEVKNV